MPDTVLSPLERRIAGNLSIPRNVDDLFATLLADPHARNPSVREPGGIMRPGAPLTADQVADELGALEAIGLVINLGEHDHLGKLAGRLESSTGKFAAAVAMHDDKARNYVNRLARPDRAWRGLGDLYIYTGEAHDLLTGPVPGLDERELTTAELELLVDKEARRVISGDPLAGSIFDEDGGSLTEERELADALLPEEFHQWVSIVASEHLQRTGERIGNYPIAGGSYGDATELLILAAETGGTAYGETSPTFGALTTVAVTDADTGSTITRAGYTGYADKSIANSDYNAPSAGAHTNANAITWAGATAGSSTVIGFARVTTSGGGRLIRRASIASVIVSAVNTPASIAAGQLNESVD